MQTRQVRQMISRAIQVEEQTDNLRNQLILFFQARQAALNTEQINALVDFIRQYIEHSVALIEQLAIKAREERVFNEIKFILDAAVQYYHAPNDLIPDQFGLLGLIDDAYLTHGLIQAVSDRYWENTGCKLVPSETNTANQVIRSLIGEPQASILDQSILQTLNGPQIQQSLMQLLQLGSMFNVQGPDPVWGGASIDEVVNARLGAMGVV